MTQAEPKKKKKKAPTELIKQNIRVLNTLSRAKYEYIHSQKKSC